MTFWALQQRLLDNLRQRVRNGDLSERRLAKLTGTSQPHIHNVLKGVRMLSTELADEIIEILQIDLAELMGVESDARFDAQRSIPLISRDLGSLDADIRFDRSLNTAIFPVQLVGNLDNPLAAVLGNDPEMTPRFQKGDMVLIEQASTARLEVIKHAAYVVETVRGVRLRYIRRGGRVLYLSSEQTIQCPSKWEPVSLAGREMLDIVRGRVVWISRQLETRGFAA
jgi:hypothetical protein